MKWKEQYHRFRAWQRNPISYENKSKSTIVCKNCGTEYSDNYCPRCGQSAGVGRIGWNTVRQGIMMLWGMDSRSLGYTIVQLLLRPGFLIRDYLSGKRMVSFPPVKMLFIIAVGYVLIEYFLPNPETMEAPSPDAGIIDNIDYWMSTHVAWGAMIFTAFQLLPTWFVFRYAPGYRKHTLPEGFFIQVFMACIMEIGVIIMLFIGKVSVILYLLFVFYYVVAYFQLFGYRLWGTLWRSAVTMYLTVLVNELVLMPFYIYENGTNHLSEQYSPIQFAVGLALLPIVYYINKRTYQKDKHTEE